VRLEDGVVGKEAVVNLNSIMIGSENPERLTDYYSKLFGKPTWDEEGFAGWQLGTGSITVGAHDQVKGKNASPGRILWNIETPDVKAEFERLKEAGARVVQEPYKPGDGTMEFWVCTFADPDDNYFQLMSPMPM
jgi:predicted enzyme related to lactoylglutathione lyase